MLSCCCWCCRHRPWPWPGLQLAAAPAAANWLAGLALDSLLHMSSPAATTTNVTNTCKLSASFFPAGNTRSIWQNIFPKPSSTSSSHLPQLPCVFSPITFSCSNYSFAQHLLIYLHIYYDLFIVIFSPLPLILSHFVSPSSSFIFFFFYYYAVGFLSLFTKHLNIFEKQKRNTKDSRKESNSNSIPKLDKSRQKLVICSPDKDNYTQIPCKLFHNEF